MNKNWTDIKSLRQLYKDRKISPVEVTKYYLDRIAKYNSKINAFLTVTDKQAMETAARLNIRNLEKLPLFGVPVAFKDIYMTQGIKTTAGSKVLENYIGQYDATVVKKYMDAGAVILGKLNCDAWAHGSSGENSDFGPTRNPWNTDYVSGGSSSGSAAAVSADLCMVAGGSDTGGSIRCPASFTSTVGLKPTYGRVSRYGIIAMASSLDSIGHFGNSVADVAVTLGVTAGRDPMDATSSAKPIDIYDDFSKKDLRGVKIGVPREFLSQGIDSDVMKIFDNSVEEFKKLGAEIIQVSLPHAPDALTSYYVIQPAEVSSNLARFDGIRYGQSRDKFGPEAKRRILLGTFTLSAGYYEAYYKTAVKVRNLIATDFVQAFIKADLLLAPVMPHPAFKIGQKAADPLALYLEDILTVPVNLAGLPAISIPAGFSHGLPIGIQLIGPKFCEKNILGAAQLFEQATRWHHEKPQI